MTKWKMEVKSSPVHIDRLPPALGSLSRIRRAEQRAGRALHQRGDRLPSQRIVSCTRAWDRVRDKPHGTASRRQESSPPRSFALSR